MKKIIVSVTNDLATDQRVYKVCSTLEKIGYNIVLLGRILPNSLPLNRTYTTKRFKLFFNKGPLFYAEINIRICIYLLLNKADVLLSNDLDTLASNYFASKIKRIPLVYDSHEYYTGVPELQGRPIVKKIWEKIEGFIFPKLKYVYTVNKVIADVYSEKYKVDVEIVRNAALKWKPLEKKTRMDLGLPNDKRIIIFQSAGINIQRGMEELVESMQYIENTLLLIIGSGDALPVLKAGKKNKILSKNVF
jgi:glycosyltransferase involved in cell wall biosynthesis